jgi:hypothetical protein
MTAQQTEAFRPAIEALRSELANLERRAAETRALLEQLCAWAGIAADPPAGAVAPAKTATATKPPPRAHPPGRSSASRSGTSKTTTAAAKPDQAASSGELAKIADTIVSARATIERATRDRDVGGLKQAIEQLRRARRKGGELLRALHGQIKLPPGVTKVDARGWRRAASLAPHEFEALIQRATRKAVAAISSGTAAAAPERGTARVKDKTSTTAAPRPTMKISPWKQEADGSLSRTLSAEVDGEAARSAAGA